MAELESIKSKIHELDGIVTVILHYSQLLQESLDAASKAKAEKLVDAANKAGAILRELNIELNKAK